MKNILNRICKKLVHWRLGKSRRGLLCIEEPSGVRNCFGKEDEHIQPANIKVHNDNFYRRVVTGGSIGCGESYMYGEFQTSDLPGFIAFFFRNIDKISPQGRRVNLKFKNLALLRNAFYKRRRRNSVRQAGKNIAAHYDLSPEFFSLFLDETLTYSCALFQKHPSNKKTNSIPAHLKRAQIDKIDTVTSPVQNGMRVLEIGAGWGELACRLAETKDVHVDTVTISQKQFEVTQKKIIARGLQDRVHVRLQDYRFLKGGYDAIVSVEMIEAVGPQYLRAFFSKCDELLKPGGALSLQSITIADQDYPMYARSNDFIRQYIFPGGHLPSVQAMVNITAKFTSFNLESSSSHAADYVKTLRIWRDNFLNRLDEARQLGFDDAFLRMWDFYLAGCEAAFLSGPINLHRLIFRKNKIFP